MSDIENKDENIDAVAAEESENEDVGYVTEEETLKDGEDEEESLDEMLERINTGRSESAADNFTITSDIGMDDQRAFFYYSILLKNKLVTAVYIIAPILAAVYLTFRNQREGISSFFIYLILLYAIVFGIAIFRAERVLKKIKKETPEALRLTKTTYLFKYDTIVYNKNQKTTRVPYKNLLKYGKTHSRFFMYFAGSRAMVIRTDDIKKVMPLKDFEAYIKSKMFK